MKNNIILKFGVKNDLVKLLQKKLNIKPDGDFGKVTETALKQWQKNNNLPETGIADIHVLEKMGIGFYNNKFNIEIIKYYLDKDAVVKNNNKLTHIFLHHTAGGDNPFLVVDYWNNLKNEKGEKKKIATEFVVGGQSIDNKRKDYDGWILKTFEDGEFGWHLGINNSLLHLRSCGIEICNFGNITKGGYFNEQNKWINLNNNKYYNYKGGEVDPSQVYLLKFEFRGFKYWHNYTDTQINNLRKLLYYLAEKYNIDIRKGIREILVKDGIEKAFSYYDSNYILNNPGLWAHVNVRKDKFDIYPHEKLVEMIYFL